MSRTLLRVPLLLVLIGLTAGAGLGQENKEVKKLPVTLKVRVPDSNVQLWINDQPTKQTGTLRTFISPALEPGKEYYYTLKMLYEPNNYTKITRSYDILVEAGKEVEADLTKPNPNRPDEIRVRYVPTPWEVAEEMCKLAGVKKGEVVFDLGCGDGRMVITAVKKFGAKRGVGVDIDPERIKDSNANARSNGVEDKVEFRQADVLKLKDVSEADVVLLYLGDDLNNAIKPLLQKTLKPGARVVSHRFRMGDWKPDKSVRINVDGSDYDLHLWVIGERKE
jgi:uncharacterized protein (TIGR03000 family)